ncbi:MAG: FGGY family carbohydrate kinase [Ignisphaera sp.]
MMKIISIDVGTSKIKGAFIKLGEEGLNIIETIEEDQHIIRPTLESHEHSPVVVLDTIKSIIKHLSLREKPDVLVFSSYLFALTLANSKGEYLSNTITWLDERPQKVINLLKPYAKELYKRTGVPPIYIFSLPKILYLKKYCPDLISKVKYFLDSKSVITFYFLGYPVTDYSTASGTYQMLNISTLKWDDLAFELTGLDDSMLPELKEGDYVGEVRSSVAQELNLDKKTPIVLGFYDGGSMIYALTKSISGIGVANIGTSAMVRVVHRAPLVDDLDKMRFNTYYFYRGTWIPGGSTNNAGVVLDYMVKMLNIDLERAFNILDSMGLDHLLAKKPRPYVLPLLYPERIPVIGRDLGLSIIGVKTFNYGPGELMLSTLEGIIILLSIFVEALKEKGIDMVELRAGGRVVSIPLTRVILAGVLSKPVSYLDTPHVVHIGNAAIATDTLNPPLGKVVRKYIEENITKNRVEPLSNIVEFYSEVKTKVKKYLELLYSIEA